MYNCVIIDDELNAREALEKIILRYFPDRLRIVAKAGSVEEGVHAINKFNPALVFLDIEMPGENGFKIFHHYRTYNFEVIFTTAYKQYAIEAIRHAALDYLLKPVNFIDLRDALNRFEEIQQQASRQQRVETLLANLAAGSNIFNKIALPTLSGYQMENISNIIYCEADENYTKIHTVRGEIILVSKNLGVLEELLPATVFFRIHKSYLVNLNFIRKYNRTDCHYIELEDGTQLDVAKRRIDEFVDALTKKINLQREGDEQ